MKQILSLSSLKHFFKEYQLAILSGFFIGTSFIPLPPWASLFGFVPLWSYWISQTSLKKIFISGWISQFLLTCIGFNWIAYNIHSFGGLPWSVSILGMLAFCSFANLYIPLSGVLFALLRNKVGLTKFHSLLALGLVTSLFETYFPTIFPWNFGYTFYWVGLPIYQVSEFFGFQGLSSIVILINSALAYAWLHRKEKLGQLYFVGAVFLFASLNLLGFVAQWRLPTPDAVVHPLIVQANISNQQKVYAERGWGFKDFITDKFYQLTDEGLAKSANVDFVVWPETAFPDYINQGFIPSVRELKKYGKSKNLPIITGAYTRLRETNASSNSLYFIDSEGIEVTPRYDKSLLLAFGEYIPGANTFPIFRKWLPMIANFTPGTGPMLKDFIGYKIGPQICYESLYPQFSKALADQGAQFIINVTNDSWFGWWAEPYQHLYMTLARGVEFRRPVIRSTNTGITAVGLANGEVLTKSPIGEEWANTYTVPYLNDPQPTFYQKTYYLIPLLLLLALIFVLIRSAKLKVRN